MRHAKSSWEDRSISDHDRPLNRRGLEDTPRMANWLDAQNAAPDIIISSSANRAQTTAQLLAENLNSDVSVEVIEEFYLAGPKVFYVALAQLPENFQRPMVIAHNPGLEDLVEELSGHYETMATATIAHIDLPIESWSEFKKLDDSKLLAIWRPKEI